MMYPNWTTTHMPYLSTSSTILDRYPCVPQEVIGWGVRVSLRQGDRSFNPPQIRNPSAFITKAVYPIVTERKTAGVGWGL